MAAYEGEGFSDTANPASAEALLELTVSGDLTAPLVPYVDGDGTLELTGTGWYSQSDPLVVPTNHYHKRGWRTESNAYVEWESTDRNTPYPGGGTVEPAVGAVVYQWVTYSNGQPPA